MSVVFELQDVICGERFQFRDARNKLFTVQGQQNETRGPIPLPAWASVETAWLLRLGLVYKVQQDQKSHPKLGREL